MRVVIDTNVLISGIFFDGPPARILRAWREDELSFIVSPEILEEYFAVCERIAQRHPDIDTSRILQLITQRSHIVEAPSLPRPISSDPDDDKFLACALAAGTKIIISGDRDLLTVSGHMQIEVVKPRKFVDEYLA